MKLTINVPIFMQKERPEQCHNCNLCVERPASDIPAGSKYTHYCLLLDKPLSGRGVHTPDLQLRFRCKPNQYRKAYCAEDGCFSVSLQKVLHYHIEESKLPL